MTNYYLKQFLETAHKKQNYSQALKQTIGWRMRSSNRKEFSSSGSEFCKGFGVCIVTACSQHRGEKEGTTKEAHSELWGPLLLREGTPEGSMFQMLIAEESPKRKQKEVTEGIYRGRL